MNVSRKHFENSVRCWVSIIHQMSLWYVELLIVLTTQVWWKSEKALDAQEEIMLRLQCLLCVLHVYYSVTVSPNKSIRHRFQEQEFASRSTSQYPQKRSLFTHVWSAIDPGAETSGLRKMKVVHWMGHRSWKAKWRFHQEHYFQWRSLFSSEWIHQQAKLPKLGI